MQPGQSYPRIEVAMEEAQAVVLGLETLRRTLEPSAQKKLIELVRSSTDALSKVLQELERGNSAT